MAKFSSIPGAGRFSQSTSTRCTAEAWGRSTALAVGRGKAHIVGRWDGSDHSSPARAALGRQTRI